MPRFVRTPLPKPDNVSAEMHARLIVNDGVLRRRWSRERRREASGIAAVPGLDRRAPRRDVERV